MLFPQGPEFPYVIVLQEIAARPTLGILFRSFSRNVYGCSVANIQTSRFFRRKFSARNIEYGFG